MSLLSHFYIGSAEEIWQVIEQSRAEAERLFKAGKPDAQPQRPTVHPLDRFDSLDLTVGLMTIRERGLFVTELETACEILSELRSGKARNFLSFAEVLGEDKEDGDTSSQVLRMKKTFLPLFGTLTEKEAEEISERMLKAEFNEQQEAYQRLMNNTRVRMMAVDYYGLTVLTLAPLTWALRMQTLTAWLLALGGIAFLFLSFFVLWPKWERRKLKPPTMPTRNYKGDLLELAAFCRKADAQKADLVYEWSL